MLKRINCVKSHTEPEDHTILRLEWQTGQCGVEGAIELEWVDVKRVAFTCQHYTHGLRAMENF